MRRNLPQKMTNKKSSYTNDVTDATILGTRECASAQVMREDRFGAISDVSEQGLPDQTFSLTLNNKGRA